MDDVFGIQENVSHSIVDALKLKLSPKEKRRVSERPIDNIQAYQFYLRALHEIWNWTEDALDRAVEYLQKSFLFHYRAFLKKISEVCKLILRVLTYIIQMIIISYLSLMRHLLYLNLGKMIHFQSQS